MALFTLTFRSRFLINEQNYSKPGFFYTFATRLVITIAKNLLQKRIMKSICFSLLKYGWLLLLVVSFSCSDDGESEPEPTTEPKLCNDYSDYVFKEKDGIVKVEFEDAVFGTGWQLVTGHSKTTGRGYMKWTGSDYFSKPGSDLVTYSIRIFTPGTYRFVWYSSVTTGDNGTEHNDTWLRFPDAADYYAAKGSEKVYPKGTGKSPNPGGASADGWFKVYRSGNDLDFKWQARTYDHDPHQIYVQFSEPKTYTMEVSARSNGHGLDKFVLYLESNSESVATKADFSKIECL